MTAPVSGHCHCGAVQWTVSRLPDSVTACNCSICRRLGTLWGYFDTREVTIQAKTSNLILYSHGDRNIEFVSCRICGCTTHWQARPQGGRMALNMRLAEPDCLDQLTQRRFDGADSWQYLDE